MRVGDMRVCVKPPRSGSPEVTVERGFYGMVLGDTNVAEGQFSQKDEDLDVP